VARDWVITAFKVSEQEARTGSAVVRMSFETERPFFPYREPADQRLEPESARTLRVFLVAPERVAGRIGTAGSWPARLDYARPRPEIARALAPALAEGSLPEQPWLNAFLDTSSPRQGVDDLFFDRAPDQVPVVPPPDVIDGRVRVPLPLDLAAAGAVALIWWRRRRRTQRGATASDFQGSRTR
jgi:hypothetical protein